MRSQHFCKPLSSMSFSLVHVFISSLESFFTHQISIGNITMNKGRTAKGVKNCGTIEIFTYYSGTQLFIKWNVKALFLGELATCGKYKNSLFRESSLY